MKNGGKRPGAGRKRASHTLTAEKAREYVINRVAKSLEPIMNAQMMLAKGITHVMRIDEVGRGKEKRKMHVLVTDVDEIKEALDGLEDGSNEGFYYIATKDPDNRAIEFLVNQTIGKAKETTQIEGNKDKPLSIKFKNATKEELNAAIQRMLKHR